MPYEKQGIPYPLRIGINTKYVPNLHVLINDLDMNYDFAMIDVCNAHNFRDQNTIGTRDIALTRSGKLSSLLKRHSN